MKISKMKGVHKDATRAFKTKLMRLWKRRIGDLEKEQQRLFKLACKQLRIQEYEQPRSNLLYDVLFNNCSTPAKVARQLWPVGAAAKCSVTSGRARI